MTLYSISRTPQEASNASNDTPRTTSASQPTPTTRYTGPARVTPVAAANPCGGVTEGRNTANRGTIQLAEVFIYSY